MNELRQHICSEVYGRKPIDVYRRNLQKAYVERMASIVSPTTSASSPGGTIILNFGPSFDVKKSDVVSVAKGNLRTLRSDIIKVIPTTTDAMTRYHLEDVKERIDKILDPK